MYEIEKNVPVSTRKKYPVSDLEIGDSFFVPMQDLPSESSTSVKAVVKRFARQSKRKFKTRKTEEGIRVWRVE